MDVLNLSLKINRYNRKTIINKGDWRPSYNISKHIFYVILSFYYHYYRPFFSFGRLNCFLPKHPIEWNGRNKC